MSCSVVKRDHFNFITSDFRDKPDKRTTAKIDLSLFSFLVFFTESVSRNEKKR